MNSERISNIALEPFINKFVLEVIKTIRKHNFNHEPKNVVYADLIPKVSEEVVSASLSEKVIAPMVGINPPKIPKHQHRDLNALVAPINNRPSIRRPMQIPILPAKPPVGNTPMQMAGGAPQKPMELSHDKFKPAVQKPVAKPQEDTHQVIGEEALSKDYGKITPLLNDPSVSSIECPGHEKPIMIIRAGQRQVTRVVLNEKEIMGILQRVSDVIHIPLLEGVFRAAADNFSINAVISRMIGTRFVIKKQTPYALLERQP